MALIGSFTAALLGRVLRVTLRRCGIDAVVDVHGIGRYGSRTADPGSDLYRSDPDTALATHLAGHARYGAHRGIEILRRRTFGRADGQLPAGGAYSLGNPVSAALGRDIRWRRDDHVRMAGWLRQRRSQRTARRRFRSPNRADRLANAA
uniref:Uncharacterized protein n=2 Tax=Streptomyces TaxID=1883 RepID=A0A0K1H2W2_STRKA|nr:hypothetical protein [Streptomyces microaureus]AKT74211.1 hypothetical protein [Streptomyces kasugaensis]